MEVDTLPLVLAAVLGFIAPLLISFLKSAATPVWVSMLVTYAVCAVAGAASLVLAGELTTYTDVDTLAEIIPVAATAFAVSQAVYRLYFRDTAVNTTLTNAVWGDGASSGGG